MRHLIVAALFTLLLPCGHALSQERNSNPDEWTWNDPKPLTVPGAKHATLDSPAMQRTIGHCIVLPPGYDDHPDQRYPVVYFLHGAGGTESSDVGFAWNAIGLMRDGMIPPAIWVFPNGGQRSGYRDWESGNVKVETHLMQELVPHVDATYRTITDRKSRAICGFSMGGGGALRLAMKYPDRFCAAASLAAAVDAEEQARDGDNVLALAKKNVEAIRDGVGLMLVIGDEDFLYERHPPLIERLDELKIKHDYTVLPGVGHNLGKYTELKGADMVKFLSSKLSTGENKKQ